MIIRVIRGIRVIRVIRVISLRCPAETTSAGRPYISQTPRVFHSASRTLSE